MTVLKKNLFLFFINFSIFQFGLAQNSDTAFKINYWGDISAYQDAQSKFTLNIVSKILKQNKPIRKLCKERELAFTLLDNILHQPNAASLPSVQNFYHKQILNLTAVLSAKSNTHELVIFKLYNHAFIIKTKTLTVAVDLTRGTTSGVADFSISDSLTQILIRNIDVLLVSHIHPDHADEWVAEQFINHNKPVIAPDSVWKDKFFYSKIIHPKRSTNYLNQVGVTENKSLKFFALPGHQYSTKNKNSIENNMYLIKMPNDKFILHTGDQYSPDDFRWIDSLTFGSPVDILLPNSWTLDFSRLIKAFNPKLIITGHENELGHTIDHREPYFLNKKRLGIYYDKNVQLAWGEWFSYK